MTDLERILTQDPLEVNLFLAGIKIGEVGAIQLQRHLLDHPDIRLLEMKGSTIGRRGASYIAKGIRGSQLLHLGIGRNSLDFSAATTLLGALHDTPVQTLDLEWNALQDGVAVSVAELLLATRTLVSLTLERNDFRSEGIAAIAKALSSNRTLQNLNLAFNRCGTLACEALGDMLEVNTSLLTLNLTQCSVTTEAARHLVRGLSKNKALVSINLQLNQAIDAFSGRTAGGSTTFPVTLSPALKELNLGANRISSAFVDLFANVLGNVHSLVALSLGKCQFGEPAVRHVLQSIALLPRLVTLDLSGCLMSAASGDLIGEIFSRCPNISSLFLDDNPLGRFGVEGLSIGLPAAASLTCLSVCRTDMGKEGMAALATALRKRIGLPLRELRLAGNKLSYDGCLMLCDALVNMRDEAARYLEILDISDNDIGGRTCAFLAAVLQAHRNSLLSITLRDNPISEEMKQNYLTFESALAYTGGIVSDPTTKIGQGQGPNKGTFDIDKSAQRGGSQVSSPKILGNDGSVRRRLTNNFNGTTEAGSTRNDEYPLIPMCASPATRRRSSVAVITDAASPTATTSPERDVPAAAATEGGEAAGGAIVDSPQQVYVPGLTPFVPQFKQRHQLHEVEDNINQLPITDTQLRALFSSLDAACVGYISIKTLLQAYKDLDPLSIDVLGKRVHDRAVALCPDGRVTFPKFCVLMLQLVNQ